MKRKAEEKSMEKSWGDLALWFIGLVVMIVGAACPIYLFSSEGTDSVFGDVVFVIAGILLFLTGLGITFFRVWRLDHPPVATQSEEPPDAGQRA
jgi:SNF family Na+-dependent transporter